MRRPGFDIMILHDDPQFNSFDSASHDRFPFVPSESWWCRLFETAQEGERRDDGSSAVEAQTCRPLIGGNAGPSSGVSIRLDRYLEREGGHVILGEAKRLLWTRAVIRRSSWTRVKANSWTLHQSHAAADRTTQAGLYTCRTCTLCADRAQLSYKWQRVQGPIAQFM
jgi:hypothetical protein